jgi:hypothetical protein
LAGVSVVAAETPQGAALEFRQAHGPVTDLQAATRNLVERHNRALAPTATEQRRAGAAGGTEERAATAGTEMFGRGRPGDSDASAGNYTEPVGAEDASARVAPLTILRQAVARYQPTDRGARVEFAPLGQGEERELESLRTEARTAADEMTRTRRCGPWHSPAPR